MKTTRVAVFAFTKTEAEFAANYKRAHPEWEVKILPGSMVAQLVLLEKLGNPGDYQELLYTDSKNYYNSRIKNFYRESTNLSEYSHRRLPKLHVLGIDMIEVLRLLIEAEYITVIHAAFMYEQIKTRWSPKILLFPNNLKNAITGWDPNHFAEAFLIANYFCEHERIIYYSSASQKRLVLPDNVLKLIKSSRGFFSLTPALFERMKKQLLGIHPLPHQVNFLFFSHGFQLYYYRNVLAELKKNPQLSYAIITGSQSLEEETLLQKAQIPFVSLSSFKTKAIDAESVKVATEFKHFFLETLQKPLIEEKIFPKSLPATLKKALMNKLILVIDTYSQKFIRQILLAKSVLERVNPRLVITTHDPGPSVLPFVLLAKRKQIATLLLQHGLHDIKMSSDYQSDYVASWGKFFKDDFIYSLNKKPETIFSVGFPFLDDLLIHKSHIIKVSKLSKPKKLRLGILVTLYQIDPFAITKFFIEIFFALEKSNIKGIEIWIRTHSGQNLEQLVTLAQKYNIRCVYNPSLDLEEFIKRCDLVYSWDTTAILWAMLYKKPLFYSTPWWGEGYIPVKKYQVGWIPQDAKNFIAYLRRYIDNPQVVKELHLNQEAFFKYVLGVIDRTSSTKHVELFKNILKKDSLPIL